MSILAPGPVGTRPGAILTSQYTNSKPVVEVRKKPRKKVDLPEDFDDVPEDRCGWYDCTFYDLGPTGCPAEYCVKYCCQTALGLQCESCNRGGTA